MELKILIGDILLPFIKNTTNILSPSRRTSYLRLRLDVDIESLGIEIVERPNETNIGIELQYHRNCLEADRITR